MGLWLRYCAGNAKELWLGDCLVSVLNSGYFNSGEASREYWSMFNSPNLRFVFATVFNDGG